MKKEIDKIFQLLSEEGFKDPGTGKLFFPVYIYTYDPKDEYEMRELITQLDSKLRRPSNSLQSMVINVYDELLEYLKTQGFDDGNNLEEAISLEKESVEEANNYLTDTAENEFTLYMGQKIEKYFDENTSDKVYLLIHGFGSIYPWLRASHFLKRTEENVKNFKAIVFFPGEFTGETYSLFGKLHDDNIYRANHLNKSIRID